MGYYNADGRWIPGGSPREQERAERAAERRTAARRAFESAGQEDRPIEAAAGRGSDPTNTAARQFVALSEGIDPERISAALALERKAQGQDDDPGAASAFNSTLLGEIAGQADDNSEALHAEEDDSDIYSAWLRWAHDGLTLEDLEKQLGQLPEDQQEALLEALEEEYEGDMEAYHAADGDEDEDEDDLDDDAYDWEDDEGADLAAVGDGGESQ